MKNIKLYHNYTTTGSYYSTCKGDSNEYSERVNVTIPDKYKPYKNCYDETIIQYQYMDDTIDVEIVYYLNHINNRRDIKIEVEK